MNSRRIEDLHSYFQPIVREVLSRAPEHDLYPFIMQGKRSLEYQACLYAQGRVAAGRSIKLDGVASPVVTTLRQEKVYVTCGEASNVVSFMDWGKQVTWVLWSWHVLGFAVDLGFRSGPDKVDHWVGALERAKNWAKIDELYTRMDAVWRETIYGYVWGGTWKHKDRPHWEWHPGRTLDEVRKGLLPPYPAQCSACQAFPAGLVGVAGEPAICIACHEGRYDAKCVGVR